MLKELLQSILGGAQTPNTGFLEEGIKVLLHPEGQTGGLPGLLEMFKNKGLGDIVQSWISTGPNKTISASQVKKGLGEDLLEQLASSAGLSKGAASSQLAKYLPYIVNKLTPQGEVPQGGNLAEEGLKLLKNLF
jgi:uncharacterized protein YidB (DUF937 family)